MQLHFKKMGEGQPLIILHGLFGSSDNWQTHAKKLAEYFEVYAVDQRNHGLSGWSNEFNYDIMAEDLKELIDQEGLEDVILLGHSMGGKTAMTFTQKYEELVNKLIVVDMGVKSYPIHHDQILEGLKSLDLSVISSRGEAQKKLSEFISNVSIRQFLLKNLYWKEKGQLAWRINIPVLEAKLPEIVSRLPEKEVFTPTLFVRGGQSDYIKMEDVEEIRSIFPISEIFSIEEAGHWIHAEAPEAFIEKVISFGLRG
jgi:pimeloyl-ACP methyl ester carboxylesterase